jgi:hypothetical protein
VIVAELLVIPEELTLVMTGAVGPAAEVVNVKFVELDEPLDPLTEVTA